MQVFIVLGVASGAVWHSLADVLVLLAAALLLGTLAERLRQSALLGYIAAGGLVGPNLLGWVSNQEDIFSLAELGVALLLFAIGLEFSIKRLRSLGRTPLLAGALQVIVTVIVAAVLAKLIGRPFAESVVIGGMIALSSTACVLRMLNDRAELDTPHGRTALGILLVQDIAVVPLMLIVSALVGGGTPAAAAQQMAVSIILAALLLGLFYVVFNSVLPRLLALPLMRRNRDLPVLLAVVTAVGSAWSAHSLGLSPALGSFVAGMLLAISPFATQIRADVQPLKTVLVTLFFAAVGMFADPGWVVGNLGIVAAATAVIVVGKLLLTSGLAWLCRQPWQFALGTGLCLAQVGEFSFVLATVARGGAAGAGVMSEQAFRVMISATIATLVMTPYLVQAAPSAAGVLRHWLGKWRGKRLSPDRAAAAAEQDSSSGDAAIAAPSRRILIIGFGPAGQRLAGELMQAGLQGMTVVDINQENVRIAEQYGLAAQVGDATQIEVLEHAGIYEADLVVVTVPTPMVSRQLIHLVRQLVPGALVFVRSRYHIHHLQLLSAGAHVIVDEEEHVGECLARHVVNSATARSAEVLALNSQRQSAEGGSAGSLYSPELSPD